MAHIFLDDRRGTLWTKMEDSGKYNQPHDRQLQRKTDTRDISKSKWKYPGNTDKTIAAVNCLLTELSYACCGKLCGEMDGKVLKENILSRTKGQKNGLAARRNARMPDCAELGIATG